MAKVGGISKPMDVPNARNDDNYDLGIKSAVNTYCGRCRASRRYLSRKLIPAKLLAAVISLVPLTLFIAIGFVNDEPIRLVIAGSLIIGLMVYFGPTLLPLNSVKLRVTLSLTWAAAISTSLLALQYGWLPIYSLAADAALYFELAENLAADEWVIDQGLNYKGIVFIYAVSFGLLGASPLTVFLLNLALFFFASCVAVKVVMQTMTPNQQHRSFIFLMVLTPEMLWFIGISGKEAMTASLSVLVVILGSKAIKILPTSRWGISLVLFAIFSIALGVVRTPILLAAIATLLIGAMWPSHWPGLRNWVLRVTSTTIALLLLLISVQAIGGAIGNSESVSSATFSAVGVDTAPWQLTNVDSQTPTNPSGDPSAKSISQRLVPTNVFEIFPAAFVRAWGYILSPWPNLPNVSINPNYIHFTLWDYAIKSMALASIIFLMPLVGISLFREFRNGKSNQARRLFLIAFFVSLMAVSAGNLIVHDRYRLVFTIWLVPAAWGAASALGKKSYWFAFLMWITAILAAIFSYTLIKVQPGLLPF